MKFVKGDKVCALLVANVWGIDLQCFVGILENIEKREGYAVATIKVTRFISLYHVTKHKEHPFHLNIRSFKLLHWNAENKAEIKALRKEARRLDELTRKIKSK